MYDSVVTGQKEIPLFDDEGNVVIDEEGNPVTIVEDVVETIEIIPAGSRWGIRADQMFLLRWLINVKS